MRIVRSWPVAVLLFGGIGVVTLYSLSVVAHPQGVWRNKAANRAEVAHQDHPKECAQQCTQQCSQAGVSDGVCEMQAVTETGDIVEIGVEGSGNTYVVERWTNGGEFSCEVPLAEATICEVPVWAATKCEEACKVVGCEATGCQKNVGEAPLCMFGVCEIPGCEATSEDTVLGLAVENAHLAAVVEAHERHEAYTEMFTELAMSQLKAKMKLKAAKKLHEELAKVQRERDELQTQLTILMQERQLLAQSLGQQIRIHKLVSKMRSGSDPAQQQAIDELLAETSNGLQELQQKLALGPQATEQHRTASTAAAIILPSPAHFHGRATATHGHQHHGDHHATEVGPMITVTPRIIIQEEEEELLGIEFEVADPDLPAPKVKDEFNKKK